MSMIMKVSISLKGKEKEKLVGAAPSLKRPTAFGSLDDDGPDAPAESLLGESKATANGKLIAQNAKMSRAVRKRMAAEQQVDATVYQYDEIWDNMKLAKEKQKEIKQKESQERKPKYIHGLLVSAQTRKLDHLRAEEKMIQRERETEGDEFADKEAFVTQAYKDQMAEVRRAEEEERQREELEKRKRGSTSGMSHFYRKLLEESEQQHEATVAATIQPAPSSVPGAIRGPQGPVQNLTITKPPEMTKLSDAELARIAREQGKSVELNDDNQIVDKRELLSAGLNLSAPNTRQLGLHLMNNRPRDSAPAAPMHTAVGTAASRREINARRQREIETQMHEEQERMRNEKERAEKEWKARVISKRNNEEDIQSAVDRYRERKRKKLEAEAVSKAAEAQMAGP
ncbi:coiled-coil domain-containing protein 55-domain containing protein [Vararia minispora EC-137]|uniref:Coiled-coil domain-containing protein 55-domain containing protein n=1 Tax=Vararia minispora EC-137 TaxID=1314806 RepID=A0ACB8QQ19_9AGAM|nr:coiled-coil domain-containing protein 55-domain containing protein [Vararia minispora EC-137]